MNLMETNVQPSFIPKKPVSQQGPKPIRNTSFFSIIATVLFITALVLAVGVFGYKYFLNKSIEGKQADLQTELDKFNRKDVDELSRLETRLNTASDLLKKHFSTRYFLTMLGNATLKNIEYDTMSLTTNESQKAILLLQGIAQNFTAVALQLDELKRPDSDNPKYFKDPMIVNPNLDEDGNVTFNVTANIDMNALTYATALNPGGTTLSSTGPISGTTTAATSTPAKTTSKTKATSQ